MIRSINRVHTCVLSAVLCAVACGGQGSGSAAGPQSTTACGRYVAAMLWQGCPGLQLPPDELSRLQEKFAPTCQRALTLPGSMLTEAQLDACAAALRANSCAAVMPYSLPDACVFHGSLAGGAPCSASNQCDSGVCGSPPAGPAPSGGGCGQCIAPAAVGQPCPYGLCAQGSFCNTPGYPNPPTATCVAGDPPSPTVGLGAGCDISNGQGDIYVCAAGLYCNRSSVCAPAGAVDTGGACDQDAACKVGLHCVAGEAGQFCDGPQPAGGWCNFDHMLPFDCADGLVCTSGQCEPGAWVGDGQVCGGKNVCLRGNCGFTSTTEGVCPKVIPDGAPCTNDPTATCDTLSACIDGVCQIAGNLACQPPVQQ
jgi:hypothetical protein